MVIIVTLSKIEVSYIEIKRKQDRSWEHNLETFQWSEVNDEILPRIYSSNIWFTPGLSTFILCQSKYEKIQIISFMIKNVNISNLLNSTNNQKNKILKRCVEEPFRPLYIKITNISFHICLRSKSLDYIEAINYLFMCQPP